MQDVIDLKPTNDVEHVEKMLAEDPRPFQDARCGAHESELFVIESNQKEAGFVLLGYWHGDDGTHVEVSKFFVKPDFRGEDGIAIAAAHKVFSLLEEREHSDYVLHSLNNKTSEFWSSALKGREYRQDDKLFRVGGSEE
ncbi:GNAT family N-acetyltransferase [Pseudomonas shahriarae]|uniref:GNAT family N-acetyltransferase n=1 Tax=Pseudomonas shahriarae TaxID=2745512 RepID=A0A9X4C368_9PSED|nr:GNAT family N-acetyltransferase [Pseudomonas shahriarae]MDD1009433.1 GNAT family N-acetyltransferase [Pseudomonas shahriarae]